MASDPPDPGEGEAPSDAFEALEQRAAAAADRGAARQRELADRPETVSPPAGRRSARTLALVALAMVLLTAGAAVGWIAQRESTSDNAAPPTTIAPPPSAVTPNSPPGVPPPPEASAPSEEASGAQMQHTVRAGESFWAIAVAEVERVTQHQPDLFQVDSYWRTLVQANADRLVHPGNPDLVYPGQVLVLPVMPGSP